MRKISDKLNNIPNNFATEIVFSWKSMLNSARNI